MLVVSWGQVSREVLAAMKEYMVPTLDTQSVKGVGHDGTPTEVTFLPSTRVGRPARCIDQQRPLYILNSGLRINEYKGEASSIVSGFDLRLLGQQ